MLKIIDSYGGLAELYKPSITEALTTYATVMSGYAQVADMSVSYHNGQAIAATVTTSNHKAFVFVRQADGTWAVTQY